MNLLTVAFVIALFALSASALNSRLLPTNKVSTDIIPGLVLPADFTLQPNGSGYLLAMERPKPYGELTLHGLWPQAGMSCFDVRPIVDEKQIEPIRDQMDAYWYSYKERSAQANISFWQHELEKHGSCYMRDHDTNQLGYFSKSLALLRDVGFLHCDKQQFCDCRCKLDENFKVISPCDQKGSKPPI